MIFLRLKKLIPLDIDFKKIQVNQNLLDSFWR